MTVLRIFTHPACLRHQPGAQHPERPARLQAVTEALRAAWPDLDWQQAPCATREQLRRVHHSALLAQVLDTATDTPGALDPDTVLGPGSAEAALLAAGAGIAAVDSVMSAAAPDRAASNRTASNRAASNRVFCAVRPPGHHATATTAMGFCLFNSIAVAAAHALDRHGLTRVAIADFDVHHGNGTQAIFEHDPRVMYLSSHQMPLYPGSGGADERGVGNVLNAPLADGTGSEGFRAAWRERLLPALDAFVPQLLLISAGFDGHRLDPLAGLQLQTDDYAWITRELVAIAERHADGRVVSMLEGGYDLNALAECAVAHADALGAAADATDP